MKDQVRGIKTGSGQMENKKILSSKILIRWLKLFCLSMGLITLNGCAVHKASFDCPNGKGMGCGSMIDVHESIKDNSFSREREPLKTKSPEPVCLSCQKQTNSQVTTQSINNLNLNENIANAADKLDNNLIYRSQDKVMRVWFNSYFDENNNFHGEKYIYTVIEPAQWIVNKREQS